MSFGERLTQLRMEKGYSTRKSFAEKLNIPETTLRNYETDAREPGHTFLKQISDFFNVSCDYLLCLTDEREKMKSHNLKSSEYSMVEKYRFISTHSPDGASVVDTVLDRECEIAKKFQENKKRIEELEKNIAAEKKIANFPSHVSEDIPEYLIVQAAHNDAEIDEEELENIKSDIEQLKKMKNKK